MPRFLPIFFLVGIALTAQDLKHDELASYEGLADALAHHTVPGLIILDVRPPEDFQKGHIPGAVNLPVDRAFSDFPSNSAMTPLVVYGRPASADALKVADILRTRGYRDVILFGSVSKWKGDLQ